MRRPIWIAVMIVALVPTAFTDINEPTRVKVDPSSRLWIDGASTLGAFTCVSTEVDGQGFLYSTDDGHVSDGRTRDAFVGNSLHTVGASAELTVAVSSFDCGNRAMNRDLQRALHADDHPQINYHLREAFILNGERGEEMRLHVNGSIVIAGVEQSIASVVRASVLSDGRYRAIGSKQLHMSDFGIQPPSALLGIIKASDRIEVRFDLIATPLREVNQITTTTPSSRASGTSRGQRVGANI